MLLEEYFNLSIVEKRQILREANVLNLTVSELHEKQKVLVDALMFENEQFKKNNLKLKSEVSGLMTFIEQLKGSEKQFLNSIETLKKTAKFFNDVLLGGTSFDDINEFRESIGDSKSHLILQKKVSDSAEKFISDKKKQLEVEKKLAVHETELNYYKKLLMSDEPVKQKILQVKKGSFTSEAVKVLDLDESDILSMNAVVRKSNDIEKEALRKLEKVNQELGKKEMTEKRLIDENLRNQLLIKEMKKSYNDKMLKRITANVESEIILKKKQQAEKIWADNLVKEKIHSQRAFYVIYENNIKKELIQDYNIFNNSNVVQIVHKDKNTVIYDLKDENKIIIACEESNLDEAIKIGLEMAKAKKWNFDKMNINGSRMFVQKVKKQIELLKEDGFVASRFKHSSNFINQRYSDLGH
jgi:hypothetical protein